jgi:CHAT domain-containing protein
MAALYDDKKFLIQKYAVAITPSLELTDPKAIDSQNVNPLYGGVSESVQGFPALEYVTEEINDLNEIQNGKILLDQEFRTENLKASLSDTNLNILHIASHAQFGKSAADSFILTFDNRMTVNQLADYVGLFKFRKKPLDLLVLSACETAQGDERSALGLSGIAVKAGARSALGTLWHVDDAAAAELMQGFYQQLYQPGNSRALALQLAQKNMIEDLSYKHPAYWSSYILINSWL